MKTKFETAMEALVYRKENMVYNALPRTLLPGYSFPSHCHPTVELCLVKEGECDVVINGELVRIRPGELLVIFPHMVHDFATPADSGATFLQAHFNPQNILGEFSKIICDKVKFLAYLSDDRYAYLFLHTDTKLLDCFERLCREVISHDELLHELLSRAYIYEMTFLLSREISLGVQKIFRIDNPLVTSAMQFINYHLEDKISLEDVAMHCNISSRHLSEVFKRTINITINDYINIARVDQAIHFIIEQNLSTTEIASRLGFSSAQYFSTVFKKFTNVTPSEFRQMGSSHSFL